MSFSREFQVRVPAKWVLCGEHSVLRGGTAIALTHPDFSLHLKFTPGPNALQISPPSAVEPIQSLLSGLSLVAPTGTLELESSIPQGAGLGSSAALCVAITRWLAPVLAIPPEAEFEFARQLENRFHGQSSGMDVAAIQAGTPISFTRKNGPQALKVGVQPRVTFHDTGLRARTKDCIEQVNRVIEQDRARGQEADTLMEEAAQWGLRGFDTPEKWAKPMRLAHEAFLIWGLVPPAAADLRESLLRQGALEARLTGAGGGGFVVALWP